MHISQVELENIKSHASSVFKFSKGTTAITGENGAGKTTIIEAVAWALFDVLDYKKEDFLRRGAKKGSVRITFESSLDEREYVVMRDTAAGYHVTDPRLRTRIADKKEEVVRFLWQHTGLEPGTDLRSLFRQAIGVPQGTFTAVFLEGATERKTAFDRLLKVEEYRQAAEKLRDTSRFIDAGVTSSREGIARAEGELARSATVEEEHATTAEQAAKLTAGIETITADLTEKRTRVTRLDEQEKRVSSLKATRDRARSDKEKADLIVRQAERSLKRAADAAEKIAASRNGHEKHVETLGRLKELERERDSRDKLRAALAKTDAAVVNVKADRTRLDKELKAALTAGQEVQTLRPKATEQEALEKEIATSRESIANARTADERVRSIDAQLTRMREKYRVNQNAMRDAETRSAATAALATLEKRDSQLLGALASLRANLARDERFQSEIRNGLCPILSEKCLNLKEGQTLEGFISTQFAEIKSRIVSLETEHTSVAVELKTAREGEKYLEALEGYRRRDAELTEEGRGLNEKKTTLEKLLADMAANEQKLAAAEARIRSLEDPAARIRILEREAARAGEVRRGLTDVESNLERLETERKVVEEQLDEFKALDKSWARLTAERDNTAEAHNVFLANEADASSLDTRQKELDEAANALTAVVASVETAEREFAAAGVDYDAELHQSERNLLLDAERRQAEMRATLEAARRREQQLSAELARFAELRKSLAGEFREKERLEEIGEATSFIRDTLKEAAPRVARNYVHHVSLEANQMFREITGDAMRTLKWGEDYAVTLEEDGYERPFQSLSGGEQMAAALSIRLALLKQLSDIRIAFFDEPTTNLDAERRENFALEISRIKHFDQLFVISHDETFDSYVDHVVSV